MKNMFSSNQVFKISGTLSQLKDVLDFALRQSSRHEIFARQDDPVSIVYQITKDGVYCLGTGRLKSESYKGPRPGWSEFPFPYNPEALAKIIAQWIETQPRPWSEFQYCDGGKQLGFICEPAKSMDKDLRDNIQNWDRCFITFRPFMCWYAK